MVRQRHLLVYLRHLIFLVAFLLGVYAPVSAGDPHSAYYSSETNKLMWFIHASDTHLGTDGTKDSTNLQWLVTTGKTIIDPSFILVTGDLTDSTDGNWLGYPNGPYQAEWDQYKGILDGFVDASIYYDIPGNHDAYKDQYFNYYLANSVQGRATGRTQASWTRVGAWGKYHFLGVNTADNTGASFSLSWPYGDYAGLDSSELDFISSEMNSNAGAALTLIFGHHPLISTGNSSDTYLYYGRTELISLMDNGGVSLYGYGHTHAFSEQFFVENMGDGVFYFNVAAIGKDSPNQYTITAIDCNAISSVTQTVGSWPVVLITAPMDRHLGGVINPYAYTITNSAANPIRALVFDPATVTQVQYRINGGALQPMTAVAGNTHLWQGVWNASTLPEGEYTVDVLATTGSGMHADTVITYLKSQVLPKVGIAGLLTGKYVTSGSGKNKTTVFSPTTRFKRGESVIIRATVTNASGALIANATIQLAVSGPTSISITSGPSNSSGIAEVKWTTTAPNKRGQGGTPTGSYTATLTNVTAVGYEWDRVVKSVSFTLE